MLRRRNVALRAAGYDAEYSRIKHPFDGLYCNILVLPMTPE